jgi:hypothetical protein
MRLLTVTLDQSDQYAPFKMTEFARNGCSAETLLLLGDEQAEQNHVAYSAKKAAHQGGLSISARSSRGLWLSDTYIT